MSATDTEAEFYSMLDDWWAQLWALRISTVTPSQRVKMRFFDFIRDRCAEAGSWRITDEDLSRLFSDFLDELEERND